jgi:hypothetical protein
MGTHSNVDQWPLISPRLLDKLVEIVGRRPVLVGVLQVPVTLNRMMQESGYQHSA